MSILSKAWELAQGSGSEAVFNMLGDYISLSKPFFSGSMLSDTTCDTGLADQPRYVLLWSVSA
jgi:hypothetical protein